MRNKKEEGVKNLKFFFLLFFFLSCELDWIGVAAGAAAEEIFKRIVHQQVVRGMTYCGCWTTAAGSTSVAKVL